MRALVSKGMDVDELIRSAFLVTGGLGAALWLMGGVLTQVAGTWRDGDKIVVLRQLGPWIWGQADFDEGRQVYRGRVVWGRVTLYRADFGEAHLQTIGFTTEQLPLLAGKVTGHLSLRLRNQSLTGHFFGRKFSFEKNTIRSVRVVAPVQRSWQRYRADSVRPIK